MGRLNGTCRKKDHGTPCTKTVTHGDGLLTGIMQIILFVCPHHSGQFIVEPASRAAAGAYPPTLLCVSEVLSVTRQAGETMGRQFQGAAKCRAKEKGGGPCRLCAASQ